MTTSPYERSVALYRVVLRVLPYPFRIHHAEEMVAVFRDALSATHGSLPRILWCWLSAASDITQAAIYTRVKRLLTPRPRPKDGTLVLSTIYRDFRLAVRSLRRAPGFALIAISTIGLGIGTTTLIFSVVFGVLLKPLPYANADRLVTVWNDLVNENQYLPAVHPADFRDYQAMSETFEQFAAATGAGQVGLSGVLTGDGTPQLVDLSPITFNFLSMLGVDPILGRHFTEAEEAVNGPKVTIISHDLWQSRFGGDTDIIGRNMIIDGNGFEIVGVLPRGFDLLLPEEVFLFKAADVWVPLQLDYSQLPPRNWTYFTVLGKLRPEVTLADAQSEMDVIEERLTELHAEHVGSGMQIRLVPFQRDVVKSARPALLMLFGAVGFVLLIACINVANLMLLRGGARDREMAVRSALGAGRVSMARLVLSESVVIGVAGAGLGLSIVWGGLQLLAALQPQNLPRLTELSLNLPVLVFAMAAAVITALVFGVVPAVQAARSSVSALMKEGGRSGRSKASARVRQTLVIGEVALSMVLLVGTGLMIRSFASLNEVRPGFDAEGVLTLSLSLPQSQYNTAAGATFHAELESRLRSIPGVIAAGSVSQLPLTGSAPLWPYAYDAETSESFNLSAAGHLVSPGFFDAMGMTLLEGRSFSATDHTPNTNVVILEEMLARRAWPGESAIGKQIQVFQAGNVSTVVGVIEHPRIYDLRQDVREQLFLPVGTFNTGELKYAIKTAGVEPTSVADAVREQVWAIDEDIPITDVRPMSDYVSTATAPTRFAMILLSGFGGLALVLAAIGIYGVISYSVELRRREFGLRLALGESPGNLQRSVLGGSARLVGLSLGLGVLVSLVLANVLEGFLFGVQANDPITFLVFGTVLFAASMGASYLPSRRAMKADPAEVLRSE